MSNNNSIDIFKNTLPEHLKNSIRQHFARSINKSNKPATNNDFVEYFGFFYDIDSFWQNTYCYLLRRDLDKKKAEFDYNYKIKIIIGGVLEMGCQVETVTPHLFKVSKHGHRLYAFGLTPNEKLFFSTDETYEDIKYLPDYEDLLALIYSFHNNFSSTS
jgi:hypothetical protein